MAGLTVPGGSEPILERDGSTPFSGSGNFSVSVDGGSRVRLVMGEVVDTSGNVGTVDLRMNGDTGSKYYYSQLDGTQVNAATEFPTVARCSGSEPGGLCFWVCEEQGSVVEIDVIAGNANETDSGRYQSFHTGDPLQTLDFVMGSSLELTGEIYNL